MPELNIRLSFALYSIPLLYISFALSSSRMKFILQHAVTSSSTFLSFKSLVNQHFYPHKTLNFNREYLHQSVAESRFHMKPVHLGSCSTVPQVLSITAAKNYVASLANCLLYISCSEPIRGRNDVSTYNSSKPPCNNFF